MKMKRIFKQVEIYRILRNNGFADKCDLVKFYEQANAVDGESDNSVMEFAKYIWKNTTEQRSYEQLLRVLFNEGIVFVPVKED